MAGPWEAYQAPEAAPAASGPWDAYAKPAAPESPTEAAYKAVRTDVSRRIPDALMGAKQTWDALAQLAARATGTGVADAEAANQATLDFYKKHFPSGEGDIGPALMRGVGQAVVMAPALPALGGGGVLANAAKGAAVGAGGSVLTPVYGATDDAEFWSKKREQAQTGAGLGAVLGGGGTVIGKMLSPVVDKGVQMLQEAKIRLTPGQTGGRIVKGIEDRLQSADLLGMLTARRFEGITDFNRAIYSKAVEPFGEEGAQLAAKTDVGYKGVAKIGDYLSAKYEAALDRSVPTPVATFKSGLDDLAAMVPVAKRQDFVETLERAIYSKTTPGGTITPSVAKKADSELGRKAASYRGSSDADHREFALALREAQSELREAFAVANPETAPMIRAADAGWATLVQMERASSMLGAKDGIFTPAQFLNAIKRGDTSIRHRKFRSEETLNYPLAEAAERILPSKIPDSGTATRALLGLGATEFGLTGFPSTTSGLVTAATLPYLPGVAPALSKVITARRPEALISLGDLTKEAAPYFALPAAAAATNP